MANAAAKTADAFLTAMDGEEPFRLLRTLPERLRESCVVERQRVEKETGLAKEVALIQSHNCDSIRSVKSQIQGWAQRAKSILDAHVERYHQEADALQSSLERFRNGHLPSTLPRRNRVRSGFSRDISDEVSKLQGVSTRIQDTAQYVCNAAEELARDEVSLNAITEQILHQMRLRIDDADTRVPSTNENPAHPDDLDSEEGSSLQMLIKEMEERCEEVEKSIALNNDIVSKQVEEMELLRTMPGDSWNLANSVGKMSDGLNGGGGARGCRSAPVTCFVPAAVFAVVLVFLTVLLVAK